MAVFATPEENAANPPESWEVHKRGKRSWALTVKSDGGTLDVFKTRREAIAATTGGFLFDLYHRERRWYAGERIGPGWKPYAQVVRERNEMEKWRTERIEA